LTVPVLLFSIQDRLFGIPLDAVEYVFDAVDVTPFPDHLPSIEGLVNIHGSLILVLDMRYKCFGTSATLAPRDKFILVKVGEREFALHVERISDIREIEDGQINQVGEIMPGVRSISGILTIDGELALFYALEKFLEPELNSKVSDF
jgi:purine-binding chemotaxis protein CheW